MSGFPRNASGAAALQNAVVVKSSYPAGTTKFMIDVALNNAQSNGNQVTIICIGLCPDNGGHIVTAGCKVLMFGGGYRPGVSSFGNGLQATAAAATPGYMFGGNEYVNNTTHADVGLVFDSVTIDCNSIACHGIILAGRNSTVRYCDVWNWSGAFSGIACGSNTNNADVENNNFIDHNIVQIVTPVATPGQHCIWIPKAGVACTDTDVCFNLTNGCGDNEIHFDSGGNNNCYNNHGSTLVADGSCMIFYAVLSGGAIYNNVMDDTSRPNVAGQTNNMFHAAIVELPANNSRPGSIHDNTFHADESHGVTPAATWNYIQIDATRSTGGRTAYVEIYKNRLQQDAAGAGVSSGYSIGAGAGNTINLRFDVGTCVGTSGAPLTPSGTVNITYTTGVQPSSEVHLSANSGTLTAGSPNVVLTSGVLAPGRYLVVAETVLSGATSANTADIGINPSASGGATLSGVKLASTSRLVASNPNADIHVSGMLTVTAAGTVDFLIEPVAGTTGTIVALANPTSGLGGGYFVTHMTIIPIP